MARQEAIDRTEPHTPEFRPTDPQAAEHSRSGGLIDEPRIVKGKRSARAGDRHRENLYALLIGSAVVALALAILYAVFFA